VLFENVASSSMRGLITVERDLLRQLSLVLECPTKKRFGGSDISPGAKEEIHGLSCLVYGAVEICPATLDFDVGLVDTPRFAYLPREAAPPLFEFWNLSLNPTHDGRMSEKQSALGHHLHESRSLSLYRRRQRTRSTMISRSK